MYLITLHKQDSPNRIFFPVFVSYHTANMIVVSSSCQWIIQWKNSLWKWLLQMFEDVLHYWLSLYPTISLLVSLFQQ